MMRRRMVAAAAALGVALTAGLCAQEGGEPQFVPRAVPRDSSPPPADAVVLFDGTNLDAWRGDAGDAPWNLVDGVIEVKPGTGSLISREAFEDFQYHIEFWCPDMPEARGQGKANSGVYLQARYEIQVLDSWGIAQPSQGDCGALYGVAAPMVNASLPPETWQSYDVYFRAARLDADNVVIEPARVTVFHNGILIHHNVALGRGTGSRAGSRAERAGPFLLQDHGNLVRYRNIWVRPLPPGH